MAAACLRHAPRLPRGAGLCHLAAPRPAATRPPAAREASSSSSPSSPSSSSSGAAALGWGRSAAVAVEAEGRWPSDRLLAEARALARRAAGGAEGAGEVGFGLRVGESRIPNSGLGVFVDEASGGGAVPAGSVVALYSGVYFPLVPLHARAAARGDGVVTDVLRLARLWGYGAVEEALQGASYDEASSYWLILEVHSGIMDGYSADQRVGCSSPYAVGQMINHPQRGVMPNVDWQEFVWGDEDAAVAANRLHRGLWYIDPATQEPVDMPPEGGPVRVPLPGVAVVALRELQPGEELYMDYRFNPPYPSWYEPIDRSGS